MDDWKEIEGFNDYWVNSLGNIKSTKRGKQLMLKTRLDKDGYVIINLVNNNTKVKSKRVHRLVAQAFIPNPDKLPQVNHKDENKQNNTKDNLEWCDTRYNVTYSQGKKVARCDRSTGEVLQVFDSVTSVETFGYSRRNVHYCLAKKPYHNTHKGFIWKYL